MIYQVNQQQLILAVSAELKNHIEMPVWAQFVKTGAHRETLPRNPDWWYIRAASILRTCYKEGPVGVSKLRIRYGGRKNRGVRPDRFALAGGKVIRSILQQLEKAELLKQHSIGNRKGRITTPQGISILIKAAKTVMSAQTTQQKQSAQEKTKEKVTTKPEEKQPLAKEEKAEVKTEAPKEKETKKAEPKQETKKETKAKPAEQKDEKQGAAKKQDVKVEAEKPKADTTSQNTETQPADKEAK